MIRGLDHDFTGSLTVDDSFTAVFPKKKDTFVILTYFYDLFLLMVQNVYFCQSAFVTTNSLLTMVNADTEGPLWDPCVTTMSLNECH